MQDQSYSIRVAGREEVGIAISWAAEEGWNPGLNDAGCYYTADSGGFLIGYLDAEPIATISAVKYGDTFGFLGFYIVRPDHRGRGYGIRIWNAALGYLHGCVVGLDGVVAQQENYARSGFRLAFRNIRFEGRGGGLVAKDPDIVELGSVSFEELTAYDRPFFPADRSVFLRAWTTQPGSTALGIVQEGGLAAYGVVRPCRSGYKIGPLFADSPQLAERLFLALKARVSSADPLYLDVSEVNAEAVALARRHGMNVVFETARMYAGVAPEMPLSRIYGITSFEVG